MCLLYRSCHAKPIFADHLPTSHGCHYLKLLQTPHFWSSFGNMRIPLRLPHVLRDSQFFTLLTSKCASHRRPCMPHQLTFHIFKTWGCATIPTGTAETRVDATKRHRAANKAPPADPWPEPAPSTVWSVDPRPNHRLWRWCSRTLHSQCHYMC